MADPETDAERKIKAEQKRRIAAEDEIKAEVKRRVAEVVKVCGDVFDTSKGISLMTVQHQAGRVIELLKERNVTVFEGMDVNTLTKDKMRDWLACADIKSAKASEAKIISRKGKMHGESVFSRARAISIAKDAKIEREKGKTIEAVQSKRIHEAISVLGYSDVYQFDKKLGVSFLKKYEKTGSYYSPLLVMPLEVIDFYADHIMALLKEGHVDTFMGKHVNSLTKEELADWLSCKELRDQKVMALTESYDPEINREKRAHILSSLRKHYTGEQYLNSGATSSIFARDCKIDAQDFIAHEDNKRPIDRLSLERYVDAFYSSLYERRRSSFFKDKVSPELAKEFEKFGILNPTKEDIATLLIDCSFEKARERKVEITPQEKENALIILREIKNPDLHIIYNSKKNRLFFKPPAKLLEIFKNALKSLEADYHSETIDVGLQKQTILIAENAYDFAKQLHESGVKFRGCNVFEQSVRI